MVKGGENTVCFYCLIILYGKARSTFITKKLLKKHFMQRQVIHSKINYKYMGYFVTLPNQNYFKFKILRRYDQFSLKIVILYITIAIIFN